MITRAKNSNSTQTTSFTPAYGTRYVHPLWEFTKHTNNADLIVGHSDGSGVGMNMLLSEFAISTYTSGVYGSGTNIVQTNADATYKQVTAQKFLENHRELNSLSRESLATTTLINSGIM